jgi:hypothetical protein
MTKNRLSQLFYRRNKIANLRGSKEQLIRRQAVICAAGNWGGPNGSQFELKNYFKQNI